MKKKQQKPTKQKTGKKRTTDFFEYRYIHIKICLCEIFRNQFEYDIIQVIINLWEQKTTEQKTGKKRTMDFFEYIHVKICFCEIFKNQFVYDMNLVNFAACTMSLP